jgi:hypothetical protein
MRDEAMIEQITDRAIATKGLLGFIWTAAGIVASLKAATVLFQFVAAFCAALAGVITVYVMVKNLRNRKHKPKLGIRLF